MKTTNLTLSKLSSGAGARRRKKRVGCGESSGHGKTSGRGHKGQKARSGGSIRLGFEGGQMPLLRKLPKRGFGNTQFEKTWGIVNIRALSAFPDGGVVDERSLRERFLIRGAIDGVKILGDGEIAKVVVVRVNAISKTARRKIEAAGGSIETTG